MRQRSAVDPRHVLRGEPLPVHRDLGVVVLCLAQIVSRQGHVEAPRFLPDGRFAWCRESARARVFEGQKLDSGQRAMSAFLSLLVLFA